MCWRPQTGRKLTRDAKSDKSFLVKRVETDRGRAGKVIYVRV